MAMISAKGSSHLKRYISGGGAKENDNSLFNQHLAGFQKCSSYPGLTVMGVFFEKTSLYKLPEIGDKRQKKYIEDKKSQFIQFALDLAGFGEIETLGVLLSNDYKTFLTDHKGHMLKLSKGARKKWSKMSPAEQCNYDIYTEKVWTVSARVHLNTQFLKYENILKLILRRSTLEVFHHSSVLERISPQIPFLPLYFAIFNSVLEKYLEIWTKQGTFKNKFGKPIVCKFVNVKDKFFLRADPQSVFTQREISLGGELTHRNDEAMDELVAAWRSKMIFD